MRRFALASTILLAALAVPALPAAAKPTDAQIAAVKANCRSDFMSNCWGVPRGGAEAMQCLKEHLPKLSPGCQGAVKSIFPPAATTTATPKAAPVEPAPASAAEPAAPQSPPASSGSEAKAATPAAPPQESAPAAAAAPKEAAAPAATTPAPTPQSAATQAKAAPSAAAKPAAVAPAATAPEAAPAAAPEAVPAIIGFIPPRKKLMVLKNCREDLDTYCAGVSYGDGRQLHCLFSKKSELSSGCQGALAKLTR